MQLNASHWSWPAAIDPAFVKRYGSTGYGTSASVSPVVFIRSLRFFSEFLCKTPFRPFELSFPGERGT